MDMYKIINILGLIFTKMGGFIGQFKKFLPLAFSLLIILISLVGSLAYSIQQGDFTIFLKDVGERLLGIDYNINSIVENFLETKSISIFNFLELISNIYILIFIYIKFLFQIVTNATGTGGSTFGAWLIAILIVGAIEFASIALIKQKAFVPYQGLYMGITNFVPMIQNLSIGNIGIVDKYSSFFNATVDDKYKDMI